MVVQVVCRPLPLTVAVYPLTGLLPDRVGAPHEITNSSACERACTAVGAPGRYEAAAPAVPAPARSPAAMRLSARQVVAILRFDIASSFRPPTGRVPDSHLGSRSCG